MQPMKKYQYAICLNGKLIDADPQYKDKPSFCTHDELDTNLVQKELVNLYGYPLGTAVYYEGLSYDLNCIQARMLSEWKVAKVA